MIGGNRRIKVSRSKSVDSEEEIAWRGIDLFFEGGFFLSFLMILAALDVHVMQEGEVDVEGDRDIDEHQSDVLIALDFQDRVGKVASA